MLVQSWCREIYFRNRVHKMQNYIAWQLKWYTLHTHKYLFLCDWVGLHVCVCVYVYIRVYIHTHANIHAQTHTHIYGARVGVCSSVCILNIRWEMDCMFLYVRDIKNVKKIVVIEDSSNTVYSVLNCPKKAQYIWYCIVSRRFWRKWIEIIKCPLEAIIFKVHFVCHSKRFQLCQYVI